MTRLLRALLCALFLVSQIGAAAQAGPPAIPPSPPATASQVEAVLGQIRDPIYFAKSSNLRRWHSALAKLRAGVSRPLVAFIGDSLTTAAGAGTTSANTWTTAAEPRSITAHFVKALAARGYPASRQSWFASSGLASPAIKVAYDPRLVINTGWSGGNQTLGGVMWATNGTPRLDFTPEGQVDTVVTFSKLRANDGIFTVSADGGAAISTINGSPSGGSTPDGFVKTTTTVTKGAHTFNMVRTSGGYVSLVGQIAYDSTVPAVDVVNGGAFGTVSAYHSSNGNANYWNAANFLATLQPDLVVIQLGANDLNTGVSVDTYTANILDIVTKAKATGADVVVAISSFGNTGGYGTDAQRLAYRQAVIGLCAAQGCVVVDYAARSLNYTSANALGLMRDSIHKTEPGYADDAALLARAIIP